jgi:tRNA A-37 threonylcarbamoyl transferase component Bud32
VGRITEFMLILQEQVACWKNGNELTAESLLQKYPWLRNDPEQACLLILSERDLCRERGRSIEKELLDRFPQWRTALEALFRTDETVAEVEPGEALPAPSPARDEPGDDEGMSGPPALNRYRIEGADPIGYGVSSHVWKARDVDLAREVAIKVIDRRLCKSTDQFDRFRDEARTLAQLRHPNVVTVYDVIDLNAGDGRICIVMDLFKHGSLAECIGKSGFSSPENQTLVDRKTAIGRQRWIAENLAAVARAIHFVHGRGYFHRDLKPGNLLVDDQGHWIVADFGLAKRAEDVVVELTSVVGTPQYMAPELIAPEHGLPSLAAADVYSLGAVLYVLLTGRPTIAEVALAAARADAENGNLLPLHELICNAPIQPPRELDLTVDPDLDAICMKCLKKGEDANERYETPAALAADLQLFLGGKPIEARPVSVRVRAAKWVKRNRWVAALLGVICTLTVLGAAAVGWQYRATVIALEEAEWNSALSHMVLAANEVEHNELNRATQDLSRIKQWAESRDVDPGFVWHYLNRCCHNEALDLNSDGARVLSLSYSRDGKRLAAGGNDGFVRLYDAETGHLLRRLNAYETPPGKKRTVGPPPKGALRGRGFWGLVSGVDPDPPGIRS